MRKMKVAIQFFVFSLCLCVSAVQSSVLRAADLQAGFGEADITPKLGDKPVYLAGFGHNRKAESIADPIIARAAVLADGKRKIALVAVDVVGFFNTNVMRVRAQLKGFDYA